MKFLILLTIIFCGNPELLLDVNFIGKLRKECALI